ncbi:hypothetical protein HD806DRAFT_526634 [Xylariaceae sp. AK1471]|nr:hypothetical protein HD806DRAFT_526634 [Xylariaceae sp. AK1471]
MAFIFEDLRDEFYHPRYSDLTIVCEDGMEFKLHRIVVALHSPVLDSMISEDVNDRGQVVSRIELPDVKFDTLYMAMQFCYGGNYNDYERIGSFHYPSNIIFLTYEEIETRLRTLPCLQVISTTESTSVDGDYNDDNAEEEDEELDENFSDGDTDTESNSSSQELEDEEDEDNRRTRTFQGHSLFDSLRVYCLASRFEIAPLRLLARERFYRTAEKVLMFSPKADVTKEAQWWTQDHQRIYRSKLAEAVFHAFPQVIDELYQTVPETDTLMRSIPALLIAAGYNDEAFRDNMKPLLDKYPDLALAVLEGMRIPA